MFSRATKSIVKTIGQRKYHAGEENIKLAVIGGAGEIGRSLSQMLKRTSKLDVLALYDVAALNKRFLTPIKLNYFSNEKTTNLSNSRMLTMLQKSRSSKGDYRSENFQGSFYTNRAPKLNQNATEKFVESLRQLPIAEECATNQFSKPTIKSQGDHACARDLQGPRVLAEMGPASYPHSGRIVTEIYRQFPDFAIHLNKARSNNDDVAPTRRWYSNVVLSPDVQSKLDQEAVPIADFEIPYFEEASSRNAENIAATVKSNSMAEKTDRKNRTRRKDARQLKITSSEQTVKRRLLKDTENRAQTMQKSDKTQRRNEARRCNESKIVERTMIKIDARSRNTGKSKNWTIPAALSDKKPKMLYGLVRQRRKPLTSFFYRFFDIQSGEPVDDCCSSKIDRLNTAANQKLVKESNIEDKPREKRSNVSTSVSDLTADLPKAVTSTDNAKRLGQTESSMTTERSDENCNCEVNEDRGTTSSHSESENDTNERNESQTSEKARKMSPEIALFLENLNLNRRRSRSVSSLTSYNLEFLFTDLEPTIPISNQPGAASFFFSSSNNDCKPSIKEKLLRKAFGKMKDRRKDEICKRRKCETEEASKSCGKKREEAPLCGKRDKKKKPKCGESDEDPCKPYRSEETHGPTCKKYEEEPMTYDPCDKFWDDSIHGPRCKKPRKKKTDTCCQKKEKSCDTKTRKKSKKCEKSKCPSVTRAPGCSQDGGKVLVEDAARSLEKLTRTNKLN